ncbi:MAG: N-acetylglucosamine-6-phosphate deacetylase, partial [Mameliella sp.]|nr:N-acetylglucosamine-6-phosphate deacetylase [Mameliella sp.]
MAVAGTDVTEFELGGRRIGRRDNRLTLADGTLAGADLDLTTALRVMTKSVGLPLEAALQAAITSPAALIGKPATGLAPGRHALSDMLLISGDLESARFLS